ncbi:hypothetical protein B6U81_06585 [Thermoplasmatales archaeon ex4484_30]|nr:MAG: hypothetical protein FE041_03150 [Thermoplasmata archaeon]OYT59133.1 MAG: hypothetical protein B6U81_06585 [Thermoplasmatales archaeon ex4484_30]
MKKEDLLGLYAGIGDVIENDKRIGECIFNLEIFMLPSGKIEAEGIIVEVTDGEINFEGKEAVFRLSGILSRDHTTYITEFTCKISPATYPKFVVNVDELFENLKPNP